MSKYTCVDTEKIEELVEVMKKLGVVGSYSARFDADGVVLVGEVAENKKVKDALEDGKLKLEKVDE